MALTSVQGIASGLNTSSIITALTSADQAQIQLLQNQESRLQTKLGAYQDFNTRLQALQTAVQTLSDPKSFQTWSAVSSNNSALTATTDSTASPGVYQITVQHTAQADQQLSQSYADSNTTQLGTGTFSITSGGQTTTVNVDSSNNTLGGLANAINQANTNVQAAVVQDGANSYRLVVSAKQTGTANALTINSQLSGGTAPTFSELQPPQDAQLILGSGANALTVTRSTNSIQNVIPGVTLNALSASSGPVTLTVSQNTGQIESNIQNMVSQYNNLNDAINSQFSFDSSTGSGGVLLGDPALQGIQSQLASIFSSSVSGAGSGGLASIGITVGQTGDLSLNTATLENALQTNPNAVTQALALTSKASSTNLQFVSAGSNTLIDGAALDVNVTQAARQAQVTSGVAQTGALGADETLTVNGTAVALTAGMTQDQVLAAINAQTTKTGVKALATGADGTGTGNYLTFQSESYGSAASVSVVSSRSSGGGDSTGVGNVTATQASAAGESGSGVGQAGLDVAGTINGEAATGKGQMLTGKSGNATTDGLSVLVTTTSTGDAGTIQLFNGVANAASQALSSILDPTNGVLQNQEDSLNQQISNLQDNITQQNAAMQQKIQQLQDQFNTMETVIAQLQSQQQQLNSLFASTGSSGGGGGGSSAPSPSASSSAASSSSSSATPGSDANSIANQLSNDTSSSGSSSSGSGSGG